MKYVKLSPSEQTFNLATHKVIIYATDLAAMAAATTGIVVCLPFVASGSTVPVGTVVGFAGLDLVTAFDFSDAGITSCLVEVGDGGSTARFLGQTELAADGSNVVYKVGAATTTPYAYLAADTVDALFTVANGGSPLVSEATVGEVHLYFHVRDYLEGLEGVRGTRP